MLPPPAPPAACTIFAAPRSKCLGPHSCLSLPPPPLRNHAQGVRCRPWWTLCWTRRVDSGARPAPHDARRGHLLSSPPLFSGSRSTDPRILSGSKYLQVQPPLRWMRSGLYVVHSFSSVTLPSSLTCAFVARACALPSPSPPRSYMQHGSLKCPLISPSEHHSTSSVQRGATSTAASGGDSALMADMVAKAVRGLHTSPGGGAPFPQSQIACPPHYVIV